MILEPILRKDRDLPCLPTSPVTIGGLSPQAKTLFLALMMKAHPDLLHLFITSREDIAKTFVQDLDFYLQVLNYKEGRVLYLPEGQGPEETGVRLRTILEASPATAVIGTERAFMQPTWSAEALRGHCLVLREGIQIERPALIESLQRLGYRRSGIVKNRGEFIDHQWVFDLWPVDEESPVRIEFFGDVIDSIKKVDLETQRSTEAMEGIIVLPAFESQMQPCFYGLEKTLWYVDETVARPPQSPEAFLRLSSIRLKDTPGLDIKGLEGLGLLYRERKSMEDLLQRVKGLSKEGYRFLFVLSTDSQARRLKGILREFDLVVAILPPQAVAHYPGNMAITQGRLSRGVKIDELVIVTSTDIFGPVPVSKKKRSLRRLLESLEDLKPGDYVVHQDYGIGLFQGLKKLKTQAGLTEALAVCYRGGSVLYVPTYNIGLIEKYRAEEGVIPQLDPLDSKAWTRKKERLRKKIQEMAYKLLNLYAKRQVLKGHAFTPETTLHREFEDFFPYEPTDDQIKAWEEIRADMESPRPMDRLLAGDVGFGKTELAMRAAFKAVFDRKQVAIVVPTTILCEQHYLNFKERFNPFGVVVDYLSRFKTKKETIKTLKDLEDGRVDIVIGTHLLLSPRVRFKDLGLLIIDEEHRFGVAQKERLKELKKDVDCLSLSATPIPRTLEMALSGIRPISVLESPPQDRLAVKGIVTEFEPNTIKRAVLEEVQRGGQVFFVHNRVQDIHLWRDRLQGLLPGIRIGLAHGQMKEKELEEVMLKFMHGEYDLLLCTNIIGSGIDIPKANTIIINEAHRMGLADLYQLKGRVGRSNLQAFAYFIVPPLEGLSEEARRRISAIEELNYLGAGLHLAMRDLEIRGAGNLLGKQQSGHIHALGFDLYMRMLQDEIDHLQGRPHETVPEPEIDIGLNAYIPDEYIQDITQKVNIYRRFYQTESEDDVQQLLEELKDRFGPVPEEVLAYGEIMKLRAVAKTLHIRSITFLKETVKVILQRPEAIEPERLLGLLRDRDLRFFQEGFSFRIPSRSIGAVQEVRMILKALQPEEITLSTHTFR